MDARGAWRGGFASGAEWMRRAMGAVRGAPPSGRARFGLLGVVKYGACVAAAAVPAVAALVVREPWILAVVVPAFYAVEAQMVFLFPAALDGRPRPFAAARSLTRAAGGTLRVMLVVLPVAARMLAGGFAGRGFVRSWCVGSMAVVIWYERLRETP